MDEFETIVSEAKEYEEKLKKADPHRIGITLEEAKPYIARLEYLANKELRAQTEKVRTRNNKIMGQIKGRIWIETMNPLTILLRKERQEQLQAIIRGLAKYLTDDEKLVYEKYFYEGYKQGEVARMLNVSQGWVSKLVKSCSQKIHLRKQEYDSERRN